MTRATYGLTLTLLFLAACGGGAATSDADMAGSGTADLAPSMDDGTPMRIQCTEQFGGALSSTYGRLDGILVAIVQPGSGSACRADSSHVHLQVKASGAVYDIAVNVRDDSGGDVAYRAVDFSAPGGAWSEGWHPQKGLDYAGLGLRSDTLTATPKNALVDAITNELASANHVSIWGSTYPDGSGAHLIHRNNGYDGGIVLRPLADKARLLAFRFGDQSF